MRKTEAWYRSGSHCFTTRTRLRSKEQTNLNGNMLATRPARPYIRPTSQLAGFRIPVSGACSGKYWPW